MRFKKNMTWVKLNGNQYILLRLGISFLGLFLYHPESFLRLVRLNLLEHASLKDSGSKDRNSILCKHTAAKQLFLKGPVIKRDSF